MWRHTARAAPPLEYDIQSTEELAGQALVTTGAPLVEGYQQEVAGSVELLPNRALFDEQGVRMALADPRHPTQPVATLKASLRLHVEPPK